ncbi:ABC transporter substrate-binding protein [Aggregatilineales bacterium SYSU G02658]
MLKKVSSRLIVFLLALVVSGMPLAAQSGPKTLTIGINAEVLSLDPHHVPGAIIGNRIYHMIFDSLTRTSPEGEVVPMLATAWEATDETTWVFTLREGVQFQDGSIMTAEDVAFSLNRLLFSDRESFIRSQFLPFISSVEATGALEVTITTPRPDPLLPLRLASPYASVMPQAYVEATTFEELQSAPLGAGPFRVEQQLPGDRLVLVRHDGYWMGPADVERVVIRLIPETSTRVAALRSGEVDFITTVSPDLVDQLDADPNLRVDRADVYNFMLIYFNTNKGPTANPLIRRALSLAIDREAIAEALWGGRVRVMNDYLLPGEFGFDASRPNFAYDPEEAQRLMAEAGYAGEVIEFTPPNAYYTNGQLVTDVINEMWRAVGFNVEYTPLDTAAWADRSLSGNNIATLQSFGTAGDPATSSIVQTWNSWMGAYYTPSDEFRALAAEGASSLDPEVRLRVYRQIIDILDQDVPFAPLYQSVEFYAMREGITWQPHPEFYIDLRPGAFQMN